MKIDYLLSLQSEPAAPAEPGAIRVRFVNTPDGKEVITAATEGENLMKVCATAVLYGIVMVRCLAVPLDEQGLM